MACLNGVLIAKRVQQPRLEQSSPHGRSALVEAGQQAPVVLPGQGGRQLEVAQRGLVEQQVTLFFNQFNVLKRHIGLKMNRSEVIGSKPRGRDGKRGVIEVQMPQIRPRSTWHGDARLVWQDSTCAG